MGYYVNPPGGNKQSWLDTNGVRVSQDTASRRKAGDEDQFVVCLVDNGWMDAAGIAYDDNELKAFLYEDGRRSGTSSSARRSSHTARCCDARRAGSVAHCGRHRRRRMGILRCQRVAVCLCVRRDGFLQGIGLVLPLIPLGMMR